MADDEIIDPLLGLAASVQVVHPFQATKTYSCPGCSWEITPGTGHVVVVPTEAPDLRRHWHRPCWDNRDKRRNRR